MTTQNGSGASVGWSTEGVSALGSVQLMPTPDTLASMKPDANGAVKVGFDDLGTEVGFVPNGYGASALQWDNFFFEDRDYASQSFGGNRAAGGLYSGVTSGTNAVYGFAGDTATVHTDGAEFNLDRVNLTSAWNYDETVQIVGERDGKVVYEQSVEVGTKKAVTAALNWTGIDSISFTAEGGGHDDKTAGAGNVFVADDFVFSGVGTIKGTVYADANGDGTQGSADKGMSGVIVYLDTNNNGQYDSGETSVLTGKNGSYAFKNVQFGNYTVREVAPTGTQQTSPYQNSYSAAPTPYHWLSIANDGNKLSFSTNNDSYATVNLAQPVTFYGETYSKLYVSTNGFVSFSPTGAESGISLPLPASNISPSNLIAGFWDDLQIGSNSAIYETQDAAGRVIIEYDHMQLLSFGTLVKNSDQTFEIIINKDGTIQFEYGNLSSHGSSASVGVENATGTTGTQIAYESDTIASNSAYLLSPTHSGVGIGTDVTVDAGGTVRGVDFGNATTSVGATQAHADLWTAGTGSTSFDQPLAISGHDHLFM